MKTDVLISILVADAPRPAMARSIVVAALVGGLVSVAVFAASLGVRPDLLEALGSWRFVVKLLIVAVALLLALIDTVRCSGPLASSCVSHWSLLLPALIFVAVGLELTATLQETWSSRLTGTNALICLAAIPALSLAPLVAGLLAMRRGAPASSVAAGAAVGRLAAAVAAAMYALHCIDDSPLFVAAWYTLATVPVIAAGALAGRFVLRW